MDLWIYVGHARKVLPNISVRRKNSRHFLEANVKCDRISNISQASRDTYVGMYVICIIFPGLEEGVWRKPCYVKIVTHSINVVSEGAINTYGTRYKRYVPAIVSCF